MLLGLAMLVSSAGIPTTPKPPREAVAPGVIGFALQLPEGAWRGLSSESSGPRRTRALVRPAQATRPKRSKVDRIIAIAAGASIGWVVGGGVGYAVTPKRGPYDDTSGLKGVLIGAPVGGAAGALIGYHLTK